MTIERQRRICVLGLGNLMRSDDAVGMLTLRRMVEAGGLEGVEAVEGGTLGLDLLHALYGVSHLLVLDAVDTGAEPGTLTRFAGRELARLPVAKSVHLLGLSDLIQALELMEAPAAEVVLLGCQPQSTEWGTALTAPVEAAQPALIEAAARQLKEWREDPGGLRYHPFPGLVVRGRDAAAPPASPENERA